MINFSFHKIILNPNISEEIKIYDLENILNVTINNNSILILEPYPFHYECTPGFAKYFIDLGFNVDIIMHSFGINSFCLFEQRRNIRLFVYKNFEQINKISGSIIIYIKKYALILIQTIYLSTLTKINNLDLLNNKKTIYVLHNTYYFKKLNFSKIEYNNRIWTLGHFSVGMQVTPYYIGENKLKDKNIKTRFFILSSIDKNYKYVISAAEKLKSENYEFEIFVVGYGKAFSIKDINEKLKDNFIFNYHVDFQQFYNIVDSSDYIIINLDPDKDKIYYDKKATGAAQLSFSFLKPVLINNKFKDIYNRTSENSFIFNKLNLYDVMKEAIKLNNKDYKKMQKNLIDLRKRIYNISLLNICKSLKQLLLM